MINLRVTKQGIALPVKADAGARISGIRGEHDGALKVSITQAPEKGKANSALLALLGKMLDVPQGEIALLSGETQSRKQILFTSLNAQELIERLASFQVESRVAGP